MDPDDIYSAIENTSCDTILIRNRIRSSIHSLERAVRNSRLEKPARWIYRTALKPILEPAGFYSISIENEPFPPFELRLPKSGQGLGKRARLAGEYETPVMRALSERVDEETIFWEIGAQWGYFSMAVAGRARHVVAFEQDSKSAELLRESASKNGYNHVSVVEGTVGQNVHLDDYQPPDIILMDIEGWEETALRDARETLAETPTLIIEIHEPSMLGPAAPENDPEAILSYLNEIGYRTEELNPRSEENYHIIAER